MLFSTWLALCRPHRANETLAKRHSLRDTLSPNTLPFALITQQHKLVFFPFALLSPSLSTDTVFFFKCVFVVKHGFNICLYGTCLSCFPSHPRLSFFPPSRTASATFLLVFPSSFIPHSFLSTSHFYFCLPILSLISISICELWPEHLNRKTPISAVSNSNVGFEEGPVSERQ